MENINQIQGAYFINHSLVTPNILPGFKVYGERLLDFEGVEYRVWDPRRSKLAAAIYNGLKTLKINPDSKILYLGASSGTTASHISDLLRDGVLYCVEFSPRMMRELIMICEKRMNMIPLLEDATRPKSYLNLLERVDIVYCDVAQPHQNQLFIDNMKLYMRDEGQGIIMIKSRSIDFAAPPQIIFKKAEKELQKSGFKVIEKVKLSPYEKDHLAMVVELSFK